MRSYTHTHAHINSDGVWMVGFIGTVSSPLGCRRRRGDDTQNCNTYSRAAATLRCWRQHRQPLVLVLVLVLVLPIPYGGPSWSFWWVIAPAHASLAQAPAGAGAGASVSVHFQLRGQCWCWCRCRCAAAASYLTNSTAQAW
ncbi:hypothetical protein PLESTF_001893700 [Pleodorina starrii]|nr:hypothetical protein PLESTM_000693800 [Pleodorina starrii]GLC77168.1 hypothetical protein PLESTF_001893700 [Pleodorina starrii]